MIKLNEILIRLKANSIIKLRAKGTYISALFNT